VVLLMGPTATGKSALALELADRIGGEIVSVDSALVYRGMDIGTAKPSPEERARVPHHLIDVLDPEETWSAADFAEHASRLIGEIQARGRVPVLAGGTMLYFRALLTGLDTMPDVDPEVRAALRRRLPEEGSALLHSELARIDPAAASRIHPNDPQRILRALEVFLSTGRPLSTFQQGTRRILRGGWHCLALWPEDRERLRERIALRFDAMLAAGFARELEMLKARPLLTAEHASQRAVGYRQGWQWLAGEIDFEAFRKRAIHATRQLAKRQLTWLRGMGEVDRLAAETASVERILSWLERRQG
jgi:tRNA dimethylallyltransferase